MERMNRQHVLLLLLCAASLSSALAAVGDAASSETASSETVLYVSPHGNDEWTGALAEAMGARRVESIVFESDFDGEAAVGLAEVLNLRPSPELDVQAELEARGLGNARFDKMSFKGGVGDVRLDFTGDWSGSASATVQMGLGSLTLVVPPELGVRIRKRGFLAALEAPGLERVDGAWQTDNWDSASSQLSIDLKAVLGSIEVKSSR